MTCPVCGTVAVPNARFCHNCGAALPAVADTAAALPAAERRVVTVLFGDLSDFTSWSEEVDPERVGAVTDRVMAALAGAVKTFGGHVDKLTGDGIMAVFGAPVAHEDDAERAVRAALSMQRAVRRVLDDERGGGAPLGLRVGLNTGEVVAGIQASLEYTVIGDTVNTAARLADASAIGAVYAGETTMNATRHLASWRQLRPLKLKGKRQPVPAFELLGLRDAPGTRSGLGDEAPFVGREAELGRVASRLAEVIDRNEPGVLIMTAEAGLGKTRFGAEAERLAAAFEGTGGATVLAVKCAAFGERRRLAPLADLVRSAIGLPHEPFTAATRAAVEERVRRVAARLARTSPDTPVSVDALMTLLGYGDTQSATGAPDWSSQDIPAPPDAEVLPAAVSVLLSALAAEAPLFVVVDDLHDATPETIEALGVTLGRLAGPVLVLLLGRPELVRTAGIMTRMSEAEVYSLPPLRGADASRLLTSYLEGGKLPPEDTDRLLATAQGNPFYLAELVTLLMERGALKAAGGANPAGRWRLSAGSLDRQLLSRDLAAVLAARIDALPADARAVLRDAAVIGDQVATATLHALCGRHPGDFERAVEELLQRRMLTRTRGGFAFSTPLMREAAYAGIGKADLAERHSFLARWAASEEDEVEPLLSSGFAGPSGMTEDARDLFVAHHVESALRLADAVGLRTDSDVRDVVPLGVAALSRATRRAHAMGEPGLAVDYAERATALADDALSEIDQLVHANALMQNGRITEALDLAEKLSANAGDDGACRSGALLIAGQAHRLLGDGQRAAEAWQEALAVATDAGLPAERAEAMRRLGMNDFFTGRLSQASSRFAAAFQVTKTAGDRHGQAWSLQDLAWVTTARGDFAGSEAVLDRATKLFAELGDPVGHAWVRGTTAFSRLLAGQLGEARRLAGSFLPFGERLGEAWAVGTLRAVDAFAAAELGDLVDADHQARVAYRDFSEISDDWGRGLALSVRGAVARGLGQWEHAHDLLTDALGYSQRTTHPLLLGIAGTMRGFVRLRLGDVPGAEADARSVLTAVEPHNPLAPAQVGPRVLLAAVRLTAGDALTAVGLLAPIAASRAPSLLFSRRDAVATYAQALLAERQSMQALDWARRAVAMPAEDVRSGVRAHRVLAAALLANDAPEEACEAAAEAVRLAYASEQVSERAEADAMFDRLRPLEDDLTLEQPLA
ncbi:MULTISPECIES: adenylate/guanylate cyclase domain-containing protein [Catenuloplanes]|uniref:adenylate/guanylate cyclase domain-containing protein n=1 Tax=Catenuloplanes TaxID=33874 RepID=UPI00286CE72E|nr:adenylate/guanylate cyclase domain-containing protein [Catenuloplanes niger]